MFLSILAGLCQKGSEVPASITTLAAHQPGKGYKAISRQFEVHHSTVKKIIHMWKTFKTAANIPSIGHTSKFSPRSDRAIL
uniref:Uncharacterized protein n=1 Tax=Neolamprologus brichardi TaxID=32507 RepID=A0A3Q4I1B2_NEOBR